MTPIQRTIEIFKGLLTLVGTVVFLVAIPVGLVRVVGWPLPTAVPTLDELALGLRSSLDPQLVIKTLAVIVWIAWAQLTIALAVETVAYVKGRVVDRAPLLPGVQQAAARIVATVALLLAAVGPVRQPAMALAAPTAVTVEAHRHHPAPEHIDRRDLAPTPQSVTEEVRYPTYTVGRFDALWGIAEDTLGDGTRWKDIRDLNAGRTMEDGTAFTHRTERIKPGWILWLPTDATLPTTATFADDGHGSVVVEKGDSFWTIANDALTEAWGRSPTSDEALDYGARLVEANTNRLLPPNDADLIFPDQVFTLPDIPENAAPAPDGSAGEVTVEPGDHFWSIAEERLEVGRSRDATDREIAGYWQSLIDLNRSRLHPPHNPDLIHPGQTLQLPDLPTDPHTTATDTSRATGGENPPPDLDTTSTPEEVDRPAGTDTTPLDMTEPADSLPGDPDDIDAHNLNTATVAPAEPTPGEAGAEPPSDDEWMEAEDEAEMTGTWLPTAGRLAGLGVLAAGLVALINRLRRTQLRRRQPGTIPTPPPPETRPVETTLRTAQAHTAVELLDTALRSLGADMATGQLREPDLAAVTIAPEGIQLLLRQPHTDPPPGWRILDEGRSWLLPADTDPEPLRRQAAYTPAPWPALVTVGHHHDTQVLLNLENPGALHVTGDPDDVYDTMTTMAIELAASPLADTMQIYCIGFGHDLAHLERICPVDDLDQALDWIDDTARSAAEATDTTGPLARLRPGGDTWSPIILLDPFPDPPDRVNQLLVHAAGRTPISAVVAYPTGQRWQLHIDNGTARLDPVGLTLDRRNLTTDEHTGVAQLTATAKDLDGIPIPDPLSLFDPPADTDLEGDTLADEPADTELAAPVVGEDKPPNDTSDNDASVGQATPAQVDRPADDPVEPAPPVVRVLGNVGIENLTADFPRSRCRDIVVYLALHRHGVDPDALTEAIWPNQPPVAGRITRYLSNARTTLGKTPDGDDYIPHIGRDGLCRIHPAITTDLEQLDTHLDKTRAAETPAEAARHLHAALDLVDGPPFTGGQNDGYTWAHTDGTVSHATIAIDEAAHQLAHHALDTGDPDTAAYAARKGILVTRSCEHCYRNLMRAGIAANKPTAVDAAYHQLLATLEADEGPNASDHLDPDTVALYERGRGR